MRKTPCSGREWASLLTMTWRTARPGARTWHSDPALQQAAATGAAGQALLAITFPLLAGRPARWCIVVGGGHCGSTANAASCSVAVEVRSPGASETALVQSKVDRALGRDPATAVPFGARGFGGARTVAARLARGRPRGGR